MRNELRSNWFGGVAGRWGFTSAQANCQNRNIGNSLRCSKRMDKGKTDSLSYTTC